MQRFLPKLTFITLFTLGIISTAAQALDINKIRFGAHPDKTRMVVELDQKTDFRAFMIPKDGDKPYRLVIDLPDFAWKAGTIPKPAKTTVLDVRSGNLQPGVKRLVVDLSAPAKINEAFLLPASANKPNRLVVDYKTISASQFAKTDRKAIGRLEIDAPLQNVIAKATSKSNITTANAKSSTQSTNRMIIPGRKPILPKRTTLKAPNPKTPLRKPLIVIDAGHGGADPGAIGANRSYEKHVTLAAARELKRQLDATGRYRVSLTRSSDKYLKLYKRVSIARNKKADLFISLHADSIGKSSVRGASVYTLSDKASDAQTAKLAARENQADLIAGVDLSHEDKDVANILIDLAMRDTMNQSNFFANTVVDKMRSGGIRILQKPHRYAGFAVLKAPDVPSVLVEMGFMSNKNEARLLNTKSYQRKIASSLTESINTYFKKVQKNGL